MLLTREERDKLADYLELDAKADELSAVKLEKLGGPEDLAMAAELRFEMQVISIAVKRLRSAETLPSKTVPVKGSS